MELYDEIMREPRWYRWIDGLVVLIIGAVLGILISQAMGFTGEVPSRTLRRTPFINEQAAPGEAISGIRFEEV